MRQCDRLVEVSKSPGMLMMVLGLMADAHTHLHSWQLQSAQGPTAGLQGISAQFMESVPDQGLATCVYTTL